MFAFSLPVLAVSLLFTFLLRPLSSQIDLFVPTDAPSRILLLTAHPDDECLFFTPTILSIQERYPSAELYSLSLSTGDADGLGHIRKKELEGSLDILGIPQGKRWVFDHPDLKDNITAYWDPEVIANVVQAYVLDHSITTILTFDEQGISSHPNHVSLPAGIVRLRSTFPSNVMPPPRLFSLITVPLIHKYIGVVSPLLAKMDVHIASVLEKLVPSYSSSRPSIPVAVSGLMGYRTALRAMQQHSSQLLWFRWLYVSFSRYMWVNEWVEVTETTPYFTKGCTQPDIGVTH